MSLTDDKGRKIRLGDTIGTGGEGDIVEVVGDPGLVAKLYHQATPERARKLVAMVQNPPPDPTSSLRHVSICWPQRLLLEFGRGVGFLMPRIERSSCIELLKIYNPQDRVSFAPAFTWRYLLRVAANLASVVDALHARGYVVGDLNESNIFVTTSALVAVVDCDSMQVPAPGGGYFRCPVGKPELLAPELQNAGDLGRIDRTPPHDRFSLAVLIFQLLMEGVHPFAGIWKGAGEDPPPHERIRRNLSPYAGSREVAPMPAAPALGILPVHLQGMFVRCFSAGTKNTGLRPSAREWRDALVAAESSLTTCSQNSKHVYASHNTRCPWCERSTILGGYDSFSGRAPPTRRAPAQSSLTDTARNCMQAAQQGDPAAQTLLGLLYELGDEGVPQNDTEAVRWYTKAAQQGQAQGQYFLALMYTAGRGGLPKSDVEAARWYAEAARQGDPEAQNNLGVMYALGQGGLPRDEGRAISLYTQAARAGNTTAQSNLKARGLGW